MKKNCARFIVICFGFLLLLIVAPIVPILAYISFLREVIPGFTWKRTIQDADRTIDGLSNLWKKFNEKRL